MSLETLRSSCSHYEGRRLLFGRTTLLSRLIDIRGWRGVRRFRERIRVEDLESVARVNGDEAANLALHLKSGEIRTLKVSAPGIWRMQIEYRLRRISALEMAEESRPKVLLPTADEVEPAPLEPEPEATSMDQLFFEELGPSPSFGSEETVEVGDEEASSLTDIASGLGLEWLTDQDDERLFAFEPVAPEAGEEIPVERPRALHEIGEDMVSDAAMDPSTSGSVVLDWLSPAGRFHDTSRRPEIPEERPEDVAETKSISLDAGQAVIEADALETPGEGPSPVALETEGIEVEAAAGAVFEHDESVLGIEVADGEVGLAVDAAADGEVRLEAEADAVADGEVGLAVDAAADGEAGLEIEADAVADGEVGLEADGEVGLAVDAAADGEVGLEVEADAVADGEAGLEIEADAVADGEVGLEADAVADGEVGLEADGEVGLAVDVAADGEVELEADAVADGEVALDVEADRVVAGETVLDLDADVAVPPAGREPITVDDAPALPIASSPFQHSKLYEAAETGEREVAEAEGQALSVDARPPSISVEVPGRRTREPIRSLADLRPMSLAELISQSEPTWRPLAEIE